MTLLHPQSVSFERKEKISMQMKKGHEVIRFIERGDYCHASLDYVDGITLYDWISSHGEIEKDMLYMWIRELLSQLVSFHRQKGAPDYGRLSPYTVVIMRRGKIALLAGEESSISGGVSKYFKPPSGMQNLDVYCFGKIIQFIMAHIRCEPSLSKIEEYKLQKIVKKCLETNPKRRYEDIHRVQASFTKRKKWKPDRRMYLIVATFILAIGIFGLIGRERVLGQETDLKIKDKRVPEKSLLSEEEKGDEEREKITKELFLEAGIDYFLENEEYEKSLEYLKSADIQDYKTKFYLKLAEFMIGDKTSSDIQRLERGLEEDNLEKTTWGIKEKLALMRIYEQSNTEKYNKTIQELIKKEDEEQQEEKLSEKLQYEYIKYQAILYEQSGQWKEAIHYYDILYETDQKKQEEKDILRKRVLEMEVKYLEEIWEDIMMDEKEKLEEIKKSVSKRPEILKNEKFVTFMNERNIQIQEGKIWIADIKSPDKREDAG